MNAGGQSTQAPVSSSELRYSETTLDSHLVYDYVMLQLHRFAVLGC